MTKKQTVKMCQFWPTEEIENGTFCGVCKVGSEVDMNGDEYVDKYAADDEDQIGS